MMDSSFYEYPNFNDQRIVLDMLSEYRNSDPCDYNSIPMSHAIPLSFNHVENDDEISDSVIKHINQVLMEEEDDMDPYMLRDPLVLKATEESLYQVIKGGDQYPIRVVDQNEHRNGNENVGSNMIEVMSPDAVIKKNLLVQFNRGVDDGSKFLPPSCQLIGEPRIVAYREAGDNVVVAKQNNGSEHFSVGPRGKKSHMQSTDFVEEVEGELSDKFDKGLIGKAVKGKEDRVSQNRATNGFQQQDMQLGKNGYGRKRGNKKEAADLRDLLISCAEAVGADDRRTASMLLKQIRQHSTPIGVYSQRLAHRFANALEARLAGTGYHLYTNWSHTALSTKRVTGADIAKFFLAFIAVCPFMKMIMIFANHMILKAAEKADTLHVIDFGVRQDLQWPALIHCLSKRPSGPPKLRITRIELAISGRQLEETLQEPGHCLASYCKRFNVPFEYHAITDKWENLQLDDLKAQKSEVVVVHCLCRFKYLLDETVMENSPRDTVLNLIRKLNPDIFVQCVVNGSHDAPFFVRRFREALIHFSAYFDLLETTLPREDQMRLGYEKEFIGREVVNIIACEGTERIVRPETYKQWQI